MDGREPKVTLDEAKAETEARRARGRPSIVRSAGCGKGAWARNGGVGKKWGACKCRQMAGIEIDESQSGGTEVWETGTVNFPPPLSYL